MKRRAFACTCWGALAIIAAMLAGANMTMMSPPGPGFEASWWKLFLALLFSMVFIYNAISAAVSPMRKSDITGGGR